MPKKGRELKLYEKGRKRKGELRKKHKFLKVANKPFFGAGKRGEHYVGVYQIRENLC